MTIMGNVRDGGISSSECGVSSLSFFQFFPKKLSVRLCRAILIITWDSRSSRVRRSLSVSILRFQTGTQNTRIRTMDPNACASASIYRESTGTHSFLRKFRIRCRPASLYIVSSFHHNRRTSDSQIAIVADLPGVSLT